MLDKLKTISYPTSDLFDNKKVAVVITAFDRDDLYEKTVESMNRCDELEQIPIFIYLDGGTKAKQKEHIEISKRLKFKNKYIIARAYNYGCERNVLNAFEDIFSGLGFDYILYVEDDNVFGKNYFKFCYDSYKSLKEKDQKTGIVQGYNECFLPLEEKKQKMHEFKTIECCHHWGFLLPKEVYLDVTKVIGPYIDITNSLPRNGTASHYLLNYKKQIADLFDSLIENSKENLSNELKKRYYKKQIDHCTLGYDGVIELACLCLGYKRYVPVVNRMVNIGKTGIHFNEAIYKYLKLDQMSLDEVWL